MQSRITTRLVALNYAATTLLSALLLFQVQPIISKFILPWFGGSPAVWTTCMVFFQSVLFAGYAYAHLLTRLRPRWQLAVHLPVLALAVAALPIEPDASWKLSAEGNPTWSILCLLAGSVGLPYFAVSSTGPLVQSWFARSFADRSPYRLYALSNVGSLFGLLSYPFLVEPRLDVVTQTVVWGAAFVAFAAFCAVAALSASRAAGQSTRSEVDAGTVKSPAARERLAWLLLPALASVMLLSTTSHVCQDVAVMPFLWVVPLSLYLLTFIICFDHPRWYRRRELSLAALAAIGGVLVVDQLISGGHGIEFGFYEELLLNFAALFLLCMVCHGELARLRPNPRFLTSFYLMISAGGALGGMLVSLVAPRVFSTHLEWRLGLLASGLLAAWVVADQRESFLRRYFVPLAGALSAIYAVLTWGPGWYSPRHELNVFSRNFYGVISVSEREVSDPHKHCFNFYSGRIVHGVQFADPQKRLLPTAYFGPHTGLGRTLTAMADKPHARVGIVGLGVGTMAAYARPGQTYRFYEINDDVLRVAKEYFTYLDDCRGHCEVKLGDARLSLEQEPPQGFDVLVLDAFSGDAVPVHLLTEEAFTAYQRHLRPGATIAVNISNRYLDLTPVLAGLADRFGYRMQRQYSQGDPNLGQFPADWVVLTPLDREQVLEVKTADQSPAETPQRKILWSDNFSNLFEILK